MRTRQDPNESPSRVPQHLFFYALLVLASVGPLTERFTAGKDILVPLVPIVGLAAWYAAWLLRGSTPTGRARTVYLIGAAAMWLALVIIDDSFMLLGLMVFVPHCLENRRLGFVVVGVGTGGWLWLSLRTTGTLAWPDLAVAALIALGGTATVQYVSWHARVSTERKRLLDELREAQDGRALAERQAGIAEERGRLARDLHDTLTQSFVSIVMLLEASEATVTEGTPAAHHVGQALRSARDGAAESRRVVWALRPGPLEDGGLPTALHGLAERTRDETGIDTRLTVTGVAVDLAPESQSGLLRIAQEAVSNARQHAHATRVDITLSYLGDTVALDIADNGTGFDPAAVHRDHAGGGVGLAAMRERITGIGGTLAVESSVGRGSTIAAMLPVPDAKATMPVASAQERS